MVNASIHRKMSRFQKDTDHSLKKTQRNLCGGIYAASLLSEKLHQLKKDNPENELLSVMYTFSEDAFFLLSHSSF